MKGFSAFAAITLLSLATLTAVYADSDRDDRGGDSRRSDRIEIGDDRKSDDSRRGQKESRIGSGATQSGAVLTTTQLTCVRSAVAKREVALSTQFSTLASSISTAYGVRANALNTAWQIADNTTRRAAIQSAWNTWKTTVNTARDTRKTAHKATWNTFRADVRACNVASSQMVDGAESSRIEL